MRRQALVNAVNLTWKERMPYRGEIRALLLGVDGVEGSEQDGGDGGGSWAERKYISCDWGLITQAEFRIVREGPGSIAVGDALSHG